ncbi:hypothetical protein, partial [Alistipes finegoldii]|uniref:hypothetical protein n=1 Tax=Alistipes finegoldii TaxID=214856 RepID=UPI003A91B2C7
KSGAKIGKVLYFTTASAKNITLRTQGYYRSAPARSETAVPAGAKRSDTYLIYKKTASPIFHYLCSQNRHIP